MKVGSRTSRLVVALLGGIVTVAAAVAFLMWGLPVTSDDTSVVAELTSDGTPERWPGGAVDLQLDATANPDVPEENLRADFATAIATWKSGLSGCATPSVTLGGTVSGHDVGYDQVNVVLWRLPGYCADSAHATDDLCLSPSSTAVTTLFFVDKPGDAHDGDTLEADIELNGDAWKFADDGSPDRIDVLNTVVHELGHVYGLDHTCVVTSISKSDLQGHPVPSCFPTAQLPARITRATMYNFETPGETDHRTPQPNEASQLCKLYERLQANTPVSSGSPPGATTSTAGGGCEVVF